VINGLQKWNKKFKKEHFNQKGERYWSKNILLSSVGNFLQSICVGSKAVSVFLSNDHK
jgi:hypothetical protein